MAAPAAAAAASGAATGAAASSAAPYIAAGISAGSGIVGAITNRRSQKRAFEYNRALMREQYALEREQQDYQNFYNSPAEQRKRLEEAGFNPNEGLENYQSADAAAPDPIPMQPLDYSANMGQIANGVNEFFQVQSQQQQLRYQKLKNEEQSIHNQMLQEMYPSQLDTYFASLFQNRSELYSKLIQAGLTKEVARKIAFANRDYVFVGNEDDNLSRLYLRDLQYDKSWWSKDGDFKERQIWEHEPFSFVSAKEAARKAPWSAEQERLNYFRSSLDYNTANASAYGVMQRFDYLKEVNREIDKMKLPYHVKSQMKFAAQSMIQDGSLMGITPKDIIGLLGGRISRPLKTVYNSFNNSRSFNFKTDKTNIINN